MRRISVQRDREWPAGVAPAALRRQWDGAGEEPALMEMLCDPVIESILNRDGLTRDDVIAVMRAARIRLRDQAGPKIA